MYNKNRRRIVADEEFTEEVVDTVEVAPEATDLLFEAEDVAELVAEVTGEVVEVTAEGDDVTFVVGEGETVEEYTVSAEGDEEILEASRRAFRGKRPVRASRRPMARRPMARRPMGSRRPVSASRKAAPARRPVSASRKAAPVKASKTIRVVPKSRKSDK